MACNIDLYFSALAGSLKDTVTISENDKSINILHLLEIYTIITHNTKIATFNLHYLSLVLTM